MPSKNPWQRGCCPRGSRHLVMKRSKLSTGSKLENTAKLAGITSLATSFFRLFYVKPVPPEEIKEAIRKKP